jgi:regulator of protease activity HflC (stomatin/prohibitin superfamily)
MPGIAIAAGLGLLVLIILARGIRIVPQATVGIVERLGRFQRVLNPGLSVIIPLVDRVRPLIDTRERVQPFPPQQVITRENVTVAIDTVLYYQVIDPVASTYEIANPLAAIEQLTITTLRNEIGSMNLQESLTSRDSINARLATVLAEATAKWGIKINRVEIKAIDPPVSVRDAMEAYLRADREKAAAIVTSEGLKQSAILQAEGTKEAAVLRADGERQAAILKAEGEAKALRTVLSAIADAGLDQNSLEYLKLQTLPEIAANTQATWLLPADLIAAVKAMTGK